MTRFTRHSVVQERVATPTISALICTANRPELACRAVASILTNTHPSFEVLIVDQSDDGRTGTGIRRFFRDARVRYLRSRERGKGAALNAGLAIARAEIVACTDDDCVTPPEWLVRMSAAFEGREGVAVVFGAVNAAPHDRGAGFVPTYQPAADRLVTSILEKARARGIGACMGLRRSAVLALGGFDPAFGPGGRFPSCDDWDIAARALLVGYAVYETPSVLVVHDGFRTFREGRDHARRDWYALGAACAKPVRAGHLRAGLVAMQVFLADAVAPLVRDLVRLRPPIGLTRITAFVAGFIRGLRTPLRHDSLIYDLTRWNAPKRRHGSRRAE